MLFPEIEVGGGIVIVLFPNKIYEDSMVIFVADMVKSEFGKRVVPAMEKPVGFGVIV